MYKAGIAITCNPQTKTGRSHKKESIIWDVLLIKDCLLSSKWKWRNTGHVVMSANRREVKILQGNVIFPYVPNISFKFEFQPCSRTWPNSDCNYFDTSKRKLDVVKSRKSPISNNIKVPTHSPNSRQFSVTKYDPSKSRK